MYDDEERLARRHRASREGKLDRHIALVGFMGAGKSSIGGLLAERLGRPFYDSDASIEELTGRTVQELFRMGEAEFGPRGLGRSRDRRRAARRDRARRRRSRA